ncbi:MAG: OsmC family protein [Rhodanobacteraceae bacterium]|nr:OsmC family protein [Rhodanobacteraceae bacterium]MBL0042367.1 OsmC family protein [Xanthomonadales bacterium]
MSDHRITLNWQRNAAMFERGNYPKDHQVRYLGGQMLGVSSAAGYGGNAALADPEQMLLSALSSCHLLTFLAVAANRGYVVDEYLDDAECELGKNAEGVTAVVSATLRPSVRFAGEKRPDAEEYVKLHERAHRACFVGQSLKTDVRIDARPLA